MCAAGGAGAAAAARPSPRAAALASAWVPAMDGTAGAHGAVVAVDAAGGGDCVLVRFEDAERSRIAEWWCVQAQLATRVPACAEMRTCVRGYA